ncbi:MAG TPA: CDP-diacylglycerol diphosphatase [Caulobacteraceae bacterium]|jgi:CDP-diacylglycerol pyrophosphatase|nr:CDP-diacylglycerol diphosphatase [Caulobacteraceae bacterium]
MIRSLQTWLAISAALALASCAGAPPLPPPPVHANGQALWRIVHDQCVPGQRSKGDPSPCALVSMTDGEAHGFVLLKDRKGATQYLLMPTARITGIEDPALLAHDEVNYFAEAWDERGHVQDRLNRRLDRTQISVAVNSVYGRSQDQLHLHIDCLDRSVEAALAAVDVPADGRWTPIQLKGRRYRVRWLGADALPSDQPFKLLAQEIPGARRDMGGWTLALVGARRPSGAQGYYLLADRADPLAGDPGSAEELQDHACRL